MSLFSRHLQAAFFILSVGPLAWTQSVPAEATESNATANVEGEGEVQLLPTLEHKIVSSAEVETGSEAAPDLGADDADKRHPFFTRGSEDPGADPENKLLLPFTSHLLGDQRQFWTAPLRLRREDARILVPFAAFTGALIAGDRWLSRQTPDSPSSLQRSKKISDDATYSLIGLSASAYLWGHLTHNDHLRETGFLAGEAALNSTAVTYLLKELSQRPRPLDDAGRGSFGQGGASFPSEHSAIAWSVASVVAHEYPGTLTKVAAYALASSVTLSRVTARQHFPSDVVVGSVLGWYFARQIYRSHHEPEAGGTAWGAPTDAPDPRFGVSKPETAVAHDSSLRVDPNVTPTAIPNANPRADSSLGSRGNVTNRTGARSNHRYGERLSNPARAGSSYVELDSWVYPALERLSALSLIDRTFAGMKPWTRLECAQMIEQLDETLDDTWDEALEVKSAMRLSGMAARLRNEFAYEAGLLEGNRNRDLGIASAYARTVSISGPALTDSYHFGQTVSYDFGRPFERGTNGQAGAALRAEAGPFAFYVHGEYQHAPGAPAFSAAELSTIALKDIISLPPEVAVSSVNRPQLLESYVTLNLAAEAMDGWQLTAGRVEHSWGPGLGGSFLLSSNAAPFDMVELSNQDAMHWPLFFKFLGPVRTDQFLGRLSGRSDHARPWVYGQKISFHPLPNLEIGYGRMTTLGGRGGDPFTTENFALSLFGQVSSRLGSVPGDSDNEMDWTFLIPKMKHYLVFYGEVYAEDDFVAWVRPSAYPFRPGIYLTRLPWLPSLDLHVEAASTEAPGWRGSGGSNHGQFIYFDNRYHQADTNGGFLLGNPVGRMGQSIQAWLNYWASPRNAVQFTYKNSFIDSAFIPGGGAWQDYALRYEGERRSGWYLKAETQLEHISRYPLLYTAPAHNLTATLEVGVHPFRVRE